MAQVEINGRIFDIDLIVFDKDGTLIALNHLWGQQIEKWGGLIQEKLNADEAIIRFEPAGLVIFQNQVFIVVFAVDD